MTAHRSIIRTAERWAPRAALHLRGQKNRRQLFGLHAPAALLVDLVPRGRPAADVGANRGLYAYWISRNSSHLHLFEPNPALADLLRRSALENWTVHEIALSDRVGRAELHIPHGLDGEARIGRVADPTGCSSAGVELRPLDGFTLEDLGFLKVDVEGHELEVLAGARHTIERCRPVIFIELEERHRPGVVGKATEQILGELAYAQGAFLHRGVLRPIESFDPREHQARYADRPSSPNYVSNFVFHPRPV